MVELIIVSLIIGMLLGLVVSSVSKYFTPKYSMNTYTFKLYRRINPPVSIGSPTDLTIVSAFNIKIICPDPFIERIRLAQEYPGWAIATDFSSATDEVYDEIFGDDS